MKKTNFLKAFTLASAMFATATTAIAQCGSCTVTLPAAIQPINDTLHLDTLKNPMKNQPYDEVLSFRLAQTMGPVAALDPTGQADPFKTATISRFAIKSISGLPNGLSWEGTPAGMSFSGTSAGDRDGCIRVCGTPTVQGTFTIKVDVELDLVFNGIPINNQAADFPLDVVVLPDSNGTFQILGNQFDYCSRTNEDAVVYVSNSIPSNGSADLSYMWDFGNGQTSTLENPDSVLYAATTGNTDTFTINHKVIRKVGVNLTSLVLTATGCEDAGTFGIGASAVDMYVSLEDNQGNVVFSTGEGDHANQDPPVDFNPGSVFLNHNSVHTAVLKDDDTVLGIGGDEDCGSVVLDLTPGTHVTTAGGSTLEYTIVAVYDTTESSIDITVRDCTPVKDINQIVQALQVFPNPTAGEFQVRFFIEETKENVKLVVSDVLGRTVVEQQETMVQGMYQTGLDLSTMPEGMYILQLHVDNQVISKKVMVRK